ncbi:type 3 dihydrofolate reductase [Celerinatantimonas sp. YJH-8]|uniref:type 3 dihydrofolate reductase n=1 Tax=Celerinatantimonas sp. YJH-8 TaxID=3228714 RepID=UPI0038C571CD
MLISMIAAMAQHRVIGQGNQMPWHLPADLKHFKSVTLNKPVFMGRKTFESIGRPLPQRRNYVLTRDLTWNAPGTVAVSDIDQVLALEQAKGASELMIIGGGQLYHHYLLKAQRLYLTLIDLEVSGDTYFPDYQEDLWICSQQTECFPDEQNPYRYQFVQLDRR